MGTSVLAGQTSPAVLAGLRDAPRPAGPGDPQPREPDGAKSTGTSVPSAYTSWRGLASPYGACSAQETQAARPHGDVQSPVFLPRRILPGQAAESPQQRDPYDGTAKAPAPVSLTNQAGRPVPISASYDTSNKSRSYTYGRSPKSGISHADGSLRVSTSFTTDSWLQQGRSEEPWSATSRLQEHAPAVIRPTTTKDTKGP